MTEMGALQLPLPDMRGWNIETRSQSFRLSGPGGHETDDREGLPLIKTKTGWWAEPQHTHGVCAALELAYASWKRYLEAPLGPGAADPGEDRGVSLRWGHRTGTTRPGLLFTGLPEHCWGYTHLRGLEMTYAELKRVRAQARGLHRHHKCDCGRRGSSSLLTEADLDNWRLENDTLLIFHLLLMHLERGTPWAPGDHLPPPEEITQYLRVQRPVAPGALALALTRLTAEGHLLSAYQLPGGPYMVPHRAAPVQPVVRPAYHPRPGTKKAQLYQYITEGITAGVWRAGERLPKQQVLAARSGVAQSHISNVLKLLVNDGWLEHDHRARGAVVVANQVMHGDPGPARPRTSPPLTERGH